MRLALDRLAERGRVIEGEFLPGGRSREWSDAGALRAIKRRSLAKLRREVEPVEPAAFARFLAAWQGVAQPARRPRRAALRRRAAPGLPDSGVRPRDRSPSGAHRALQAGGPRLPAGVGRDRLARPRAARTVGRARRALPDGPRPAPRAARAPVDGRSEGRARRKDPPAPRRTRRPLLPGPRRRDGCVRGGPRRRALGPRLGGGGLERHARASALAARAAPRRRARRRARGRSFRSRRLGPPGSEGRWLLVPAPRKAPTETERRAALVAGAPRALRRADSRGRGRGGHRRRLLVGVSRCSRRWRRRARSAAATSWPASAPRSSRWRGPTTGCGTRALPSPRPRRRSCSPRPIPRIRTARRCPGRPRRSEAAARPQRAAGAQVVLRAGELLAWIGRTETNLLTLPSGRRAGARRRGPRARPGPGAPRRDGTAARRPRRQGRRQGSPRIAARAAPRRGRFPPRLPRIPQASLARADRSEPIADGGSLGFMPEGDTIHRRRTGRQRDP